MNEPELEARCASYNEEMDWLRRRTLRLREAGGACLVIALLTLVFILKVVRMEDRAKESMWITGGCLLLLVGMLASGAAELLWRRYRKTYKERLIGPVVKEFDPRWNYRPTSSLTSREYKRSQLSLRDYNKFVSEDEISGSVDGVPFACSEVRTHMSVGYGRHRRVIKVFSGFVMKVSFPAARFAKTLVLPEGTEKDPGLTFTKLFQALGLVKRTPLLNFPNAEFEKHFAVYAEDVREARAVLTSAVMERLVYLQDRYGTGVTLCYRDGQVEAAIPWRTNLFEPDPGSPPDSRDLEFVHQTLGLQRAIIQALSQRGFLDNKIA